MTVQIIEKDGKPEWAVLPYEEYERLLADVEMLHDIRAYDEVKQALAVGEEELIPDYMVGQLLDSENPIRVWREYRALTQAKLAQAAGISTAYLSQLESGKRVGTADVLSRIARSLNVTIDDII
jgi:DNA-binding XRE family transcriptional regulator